MTPLPLAPPPGALMPLYPAIGELVINWGLLEGSLIHTIAIVYQVAGGKHLDAQIPVSFKRRARFLKLCCRKIDALAPFADEIRAIITAAKGIARTRNAVTHGCIMAFNEETGVYTFSVIETSDTEKIHIETQVPMTIIDVEAAVLDTMKLFERANTLSYRLMETFVR